jgi:hypothetical protein
MEMIEVRRIDLVRMALKGYGYSSRKVGVKDGGGTYETIIRVIIKDPDIDYDTICKIAKQHENIYWNELTGEILKGGNTFVDVKYAYEIRAEVARRKEST